MNVKTLMMAAVAAGLAIAATARTQEIRAWRGETVAADVDDAVELGEVPEGLKMRVGALRTVRYAPVPHSRQRLECLDRVDWNASAAGSRVVEIAVPADAKPGLYRSGALEILVLDRVLPPPSEWKYYLDLWQHPWAVARWAKARPFSKEHYAAMKPVYELLASAGQKTITVTILDEPWDHQCRDAYRSMVDDADFRTFDEYVEFCRGCGLGPDISCYSLCPWKLKERPGTPEFEARWAPFLKRFTAHLKEKGWYERTLMAMDERDPDQVRAIVDFVHRHAPGMRISMAGNRKPSDFAGIDIDVYAQGLRMGADGKDFISAAFLEEATARRKRGFVTTHYVCCHPPRPNTFLSSDTEEAFWLGAYPAMVGLDGFLRWAWNSWPENPYEDATFGNWASGDTFLCYPDGSPSIRFLELRNGIIAAEKVRILREAELFKEELDKVAALYKSPSAIDGSCDFWRIRQETLKAVNLSVR